MFSTRRLLLAGLVLAFVVPGVVIAAQVHPRAGCPRVYDLQPSERLAHRIYRGTRTVSERQLRVMGHREGCQRKPGDGDRLRRYSHRQARLHARRVANSGWYSSDLADVPGVPRSFAGCVAFRESTDGRLSSNIYGILSSNGYYAGMSLSGQKRLFSRMYAEYGTQPWAPYDGC